MKRRNRLIVDLVETKIGFRYSNTRVKYYESIKKAMDLI